MDLAWINPAGWHPDARADHARRSPSGSSSSADRCLRGSARKLASLRMLLIAEVWWVRPLPSHDRGFASIGVCRERWTKSVALSEYPWSPAYRKAIDRYR